MNKIFPIMVLTLFLTPLFVYGAATDVGEFVPEVHPQPNFLTSSFGFLSTAFTCSSQYDGTCSPDGLEYFDCYADSQGACRCYTRYSDECSQSGDGEGCSFTSTPTQEVCDDIKVKYERGLCSGLDVIDCFRACVDCVETCSDGTPVGSCSSVKPRYCQDFGTFISLVNDASICGCPSGYEPGGAYNTECIPVGEDYDCYIGTQGFDVGDYVCGGSGNAVYQCEYNGDLELRYTCSRSTTCKPYEVAPSILPLCCPDYCGNGCESDNTCSVSPPDGSCKGDVDCPFGFLCQSGVCVKIGSHDSFACAPDGNVHWYDSIGMDEGVKQDCGGGGCLFDKCTNPPNGGFNWLWPFGVAALGAGGGLLFFGPVGGVVGGAVGFLVGIGIGGAI